MKNCDQKRALTETNLRIFTARFVELCIASRESMSTLAAKIGISRNALYDLCRGKFIPRTDTLIMIAECFDVSLDWLTGRDVEQRYCKAWDTLTSTLFLPEECRKIEWLIGASLMKPERSIQKICIFYGDHATGKSTILRIIKQILPNYYVLSPYQPTFEFAKENCIPAARVGFADDYSFKAIKCMIDFLDCDQKALLFAATNEHPYISDQDSETLKHIIDIPTCGNKIEVGLYDELIHQIYDSELMIIKHKCSLYYIDNPNLYEDYIPTSLIAQKGENK